VIELAPPPACATGGAGPPIASNAPFHSGHRADGQHDHRDDGEASKRAKGEEGPP